MSGTISPTSFGLYDTAQLVAYVRNIKLPSQFLLDMFFPGLVESDVPEIAIDVDVGKRRLAPFCTPVVRGKLVQARQWQTNLFKPPYIKDKRVPDLFRPVRRMIGERLLGQMSPAERMEANLAFEIEDQIQMIQRRLEWMAASALTTGAVTVKGEGYPLPININFQRASALTIVLTGALQWGQAGIIPSFNIQDWATLVLQYSGATVTDLVFTPAAWKAFRADPLVREAIWFPRAGNAQIQTGVDVKPGGLDMGRWGEFDLWLYNEWYVDPDTDLEYPMIPDGTIILGSRQMQGTKAFGSIIDPKFAYGPLAYAPKMWIEEDPAQMNIMMQASPLVIPSRVNACAAATVCAPGAVPIVIAPP